MDEKFDPAPYDRYAERPAVAAAKDRKMADAVSSGLVDSFPASDAPSISQPSNTRHDVIRTPPFWRRLTSIFHKSSEGQMMATDKLKRLHMALIDTRDAYELALKDTNDDDVAAICREMFSLRHTDHMELHQALIAAGETPDEKGSFMSVVHETVVGVRAALTGISKKTLPAFASGEQHVLEEYDAALSEAVGHPELTKILQRQRDALAGKIEEMKKLST